MVDDNKWVFQDPNAEKAAVIHEHVNKPGFVAYLIQDGRVVDTREHEEYQQVYYAASLWVDETYKYATIQ